MQIDMWFFLRTSSWLFKKSDHRKHKNGLLFIYLFVIYFRDIFLCSMAVLEFVLQTRLAFNSEIRLLLPSQCWESKCGPPTAWQKWTFKNNELLTLVSTIPVSPDYCMQK